MNLNLLNKIGVTLLFLQLLLPFDSSSQIDTLIAKFNNENLNDSIRFKAIGLAFKEFVFTNPDSSVYFANEQLNLAKQKKNKLQLSSSYHNKGIIFHVQGEFDSAQYFYEKSITIGKKLSDNPLISGTYNNLALISKNNGDYQKALNYFIEVQLLDEKSNNKKGLSSSFNNIALIYEDMKFYDKALTYHYKSLSIAKEIKDAIGIARSKNNIGIINKDLDKNRLALIQFKECITINKQTKQYRALSQAYNNMGLCYNKLNIIDSALTYFDSAYVLMDSIQYTYGKTFVISNIGAAYNTNKKPEKALPLLKKSLLESIEIKNLLLQSNNHKELAVAYEMLNRKDMAFFHLNEYILLKDSVESSDNEKALLEQKFKLDYAKKAIKDSIDKVQFEKVKNTEIALERANGEKLKLETNFLNRQKWFLYGGLILISFFGLFIFKRYKISQRQKLIIENQKKQVDLAFDQLEEKNTEILDSINYAKRIQSAILPPKKLVKELLPNSFILYKPKDIVAGDFYWLEQRNNIILFAAADCTGHGVLGAMVSVVCNNGLNRSVREHGLTDPGKILDKTREIVISEFEKSEDEVNDGMDIALCSLEGNKLKYAGAHNPLWIIRENSSEVEMIKASKEPIGKYDNMNLYETHSIKLNSGDTIYIFSDGYIDQFGGDKGKKLKSGNFKKLLLSIQDKTMEEQKLYIDKAFQGWKGELEQIDDVCVIGVRV